ALHRRGATGHRRGARPHVVRRTCRSPAAAGARSRLRGGPQPVVRPRRRETTSATLVTYYPAMAVSPSEYVAAPHELDLVIDFVNTFDPDTGEDELASPDGLAAWLARRGLLEERARSARERDRLEAIDLREALRGLMLANNGVGTQAGASAVLERIARNGGLSA